MFGSKKAELVTDTGEGRVVQTTRDDKGQVLSTEVMSLHEVEKSGFGGKTMFVTLESAFRVPVIKARVVGLGAFIGLIEGLQEMGLSDRLEHQAGTENGVDAAFS